MANAEFSRQKQAQSGPGGFDAGSWREAPAEQAAPLTPVQKKLAKLESALPAALRNRAAAAALALVVLAGSAVGFGAGKVRAQYQTARGWYTAGLAADGGYTLSDELAVRENTAANVLTTARNTLGADNAEVQAAEAALEAFSACRAQSEGGAEMHAMYEANTALGKAVDQVYAKLQEQAADPMKMGAVQGQYGQFNSAQTILGSLSYNTAVAAYQSETGGPWAAVLKGLAGVKELEQFA